MPAHIRDLSPALRLLSIIALTLGVAACAVSQPEGQAPGDAPTVVAGEQLLASPPPEWELSYQLNTGNTRLVDYLPPGETSADWETRLSFESHQNLTDMDPLEALQAEADKSQETCERFSNFNLFSGMENNYPTSTRLMMCARNAFINKGEVTMLKVIQGNDYLYVIRLRKRVPPFAEGEPEISKEEVAGWSTYLSSISVCDNSRDSYPCPAAADPS